MGAPLNSTENQNVPSVTQAAPSAADPSTAAAAVSTNGGAEATGATKFNSLEELKAKAPKVYYQMMVSICTTMIKDMNRHQARLKEAMRKSSENGKV